MQVGVDIKCMHTSFGGCGVSGFGDIATFQKRPNFPFGVNNGKSYYVIKNCVDQSLKTILGLAIACHNLHVASISHKIQCVMTAYTFITTTTILLTTNS